MLLLALACSAEGPDDSDVPPDTTGGPVIGPPEAPGHNVLILLADDFGVGEVGAYGVVPTARTPVIDGLAAEGMLFVNAWAMPVCEPGRAALQTGRYPRRTGFGRNDPVVHAIPTELHPDQVTVADLVAMSPSFTYSSSYVGKWHLATWDSPTAQFNARLQGWQWFAGLVGNVDTWHAPPTPTEPRGYYYWQKTDDAGNNSLVTRYATTDQVDDAIARVEVMPEPWLLQVSFVAPHNPLDLPPPELHTDATLTAAAPSQRIQNAIVEALDTEIGRLLASMPADLRGRTDIFLLGDNGSAATAIEAPLDPYRAKGDLYDGGVQVPFIVAGPIVAAPGTRSESLVSVVDVFPTVAEIAGVDAGALPSVLDPAVPLAIDGLSLTAVLADPSVPVHSELFAEWFAPNGGGPFDNDTLAIRDDRYKYITAEGANAGEAFYEYLPGAVDEGADVLGRDQMTPEREAALERLRGRLQELLADMPFDSPPFATGP